MQLGADADGALLQRALEGQPVEDAGIAPLLAVAREVQALDTSGLAPRAEFVAALRLRLLDESATEAASPGARVGSWAGRRDPGPTVVRFGRRSRILVAATAVFLVVAGSLGALSRSALPGDRLYPIKQLLDRVALEFQREPLGRGLTHLAQGREHVADAGRLLARIDAAGGGAVPDAAARQADPDLDSDLATALDAATRSSTDGHTVLLAAYRSLDDAEALTALADYYAQLVPAVDTVREQALPRTATAAWQRLHDVLEQDRDSTLRELAACSICGEAAGQARALLTRGASPSALSSGVGPSATGTPTSRAAAGGSPSPSARSGSGSATGPGSGSRSAGGASSPAGSVRVPTLRVTSDGVSAGGGAVTLPEATVSLPGVGVTTSGATLGGGGATLPGATPSVPSVTLPLPAPLP
jgi:hypothetical protein